MKQYVFSLISISLITALNAADEIQAVELAAYKKIMQQKMEQQRKEAEQWYQQNEQKEIVILPAGTYQSVKTVTTPFGTTVIEAEVVPSGAPSSSKPQLAPQKPSKQTQPAQDVAGMSWSIKPGEGTIYEDDGRGNVRKVEASEHLACRDELEEMAAWSKKATEELLAEQHKLGLFKDRNIYIAQNKETKKYRIMQNKQDLNDDERLYSMCSGRSIEQVKREFGITE